ECYVCNYGIQTQRTRLSNSDVDAINRFTAPGGRDIPRHRVQCDRRPPRGRHLAKRYSRRSFRPGPVDDTHRTRPLDRCNYPYLPEMRPFSRMSRGDAFVPSEMMNRGGSQSRGTLE